MAVVMQSRGVEIGASEAHGYAIHYGVEDWFDAYVIHPRTRADRVKGDDLLKQREADRFQRLQVLIERATEAFGDEDKALHWLTRPQSRFDNTSPLDFASWEKNFLAVLDHLTRIEHGIYA